MLTISTIYEYDNSSYEYVPRGLKYQIEKWESNY